MSTISWTPAVTIPDPDLAIDLFEAWLFKGGSSGAAFKAIASPTRDPERLYRACVGLAIVVVDVTQGRDNWPEHLDTLEQIRQLALSARGLDLVTGNVAPGTTDGMKLQHFILTVEAALSTISSGEAAAHAFTMQRNKAELRQTFALICAFLNQLIRQHVRLRGLFSVTEAVVQYRLLCGDVRSSAQR